ncbi:uncharacterized protein LOC129950507 [Eupeodes corollae]|uniref:uncharacterized protein LOC129950507 n=1 Tax=Eupeodes corollae TaxID=290404 RepID=UPI002490C59E|nr:uncharacterized protein LOC129950507 [Eupeodes corollae]
MEACLVSAFDRKSWSGALKKIESRIALHKCGKNSNQIFELLKPLGLSRMFVYRTIKRFDELSRVEDRPRSGRPRVARTSAKVKAVRERVRRNPLRKQKIMSRELDISARSMSRLIRDLHMKAYRRATGHLLTPSLKTIRLERSKAFAVAREEVYNKQNDKIFATSSKGAKKVVPRVQRGHHPASVMVWWGVSHKGVTSLHFCEKGVKTGAKVYQESVLEGVVKRLTNTLFNGERWVFQQDSAPAHKAKTTQEWLKTNILDFIAAADWPSGSPDLNPLDYSLWSELENMACKTPHRNLDSLKAALLKAASSIPIDTVRAVIDQWPQRLKACIKAKGGHFE